MAGLLARWIAAYFFLVAVVCAIVWREVSLHDVPAGEIVASVWKEGVLIDRAVVALEQVLPAHIESAVRERGGELVFEKVVAESAIVTSPQVAFSVSLVPARDGVRATLGDKTAYLTPDDLLSAQLYDHGVQIASISVSLGVPTEPLVHLLAEKLGVREGEVLERARLRRIRVERHAGRPVERVTGDALSADKVREAVVAAAHYLARGVSEQGRFRYMVDAPKNEDLGGYDWPRHAGATYFLAQAAALSKEPELMIAASRAAALLRDKALVLVAFVEIVRTGLDPSYAPLVADLARFLRSQQRPDGEFMHEYARDARHPIDVVYLYFFGERYYFGEEHWTCQVMDDLWDRAPDPAALDFCVRWHAYGRRMQIGPNDTPFDA